MSAPSAFRTIPSTLVLLLLAAAAPAAAQLNTHGLQSLVPGSCCGVSAEDELRFGSAAAVGDFDGDGFAEVAIGVAGGTVAGVDNVGRVVVLRGTAAGPTTVGTVHLNESALGGTLEGGDGFGSALAVGDWNLDGADDLAIGAPGDNPDAIDSAGGVFVVYGVPGPGGGALFDEEADYWSYATVNLGGFAHTGDGFGRTLAVGDFDGDGEDDLAIGVPGDNVFAGNSASGSLTILRGGALGLTPQGGVTLTRNSSGVPGVVTSFDEFARALAAGDFDGDGDDDLAVGVPGAGVDGVLGVGEVLVLELEMDGIDLEVVSGASWSEGHGIPGAQEAGDGYGWVLASGDFDGDGADDLAIGAPNESVGDLVGAGAVAILEGSIGAGLESNAGLWTQAAVSGEVADLGDRFGEALATGDFDRDGKDELVIGVPSDWQMYSEDGEFEWDDLGSIHVLPGGENGLAIAEAQTWVGTPGADPASDHFGGVLAAGRLRGTADALVVGSPRRSTAALGDVGRVTLFHSYLIFADGFAGNSTEIWSDSVP